jgi:putative phage-type endonuclease
LHFNAIKYTLIAPHKYARKNMPMLFPKSREEWLSIRRGYISSTESSALFGMNPYTTAFELAVDKKSTDTAEWRGDERTSWGLRLQRSIAEAVATDYGVKVRAMNGYATHPKARMGASFDYEIVGVKDDWNGTDDSLRKLYLVEGAGVLEIKNVDKFVFKNDWTKTDEGYDPPAHIELQVQHQLECADRGWACVAALVGGNQQIIVTRLRDVDIGVAMQKKVAAFYKLIESGGMPPLNLPTDADAVKKLYGHAEPNSVRDYQGDKRDETIAELCKRYTAAQAAAKTAKEIQDSVSAELLFAIGTTEKVLLDDFTISATTTAPARIEAYERKGYRNLRVSKKQTERRKAQ